MGLLYPRTPRGWRIMAWVEVTMAALNFLCAAEAAWRHSYPVVAWFFAWFALMVWFAAGDFRRAKEGS